MKIKVLSLNTWMGGMLWQPSFDFVTAQQADIILLQEIYSGVDDQFDPRFRSKHLFESAFPDFQSYFSALICDLREKEGPIDNGNLILSRWPLIEQETIFFDQPYASYDHDDTADFSQWAAGAQRVIVELPGNQKLQIANLHGPVWFQGAEPTQRRIHMVNSINSICNREMPTIIAGDSNATPDNPVWGNVNIPLKSVFSNQLTTTFNMRRKTNPGYATAAVDVFLISTGIKAIRAQCLDLDISDHLPMVVELEINHRAV